MTKRVAKPAKPYDEARRLRRVLTRDPEWARAAIKRVQKWCHPKQLAAATDPADLIAVAVARGGGKTTGAKARLVITMCRVAKALCLYVTDTKEHAAEICWEELKELFTDLGIEFTPNETKKTITLKANGSRLRLGGADDRREVEKYRGPEYHGVVIDEAASWDPQILEWFIDRAVRPRQGGIDGWIMMIGSPGHVLSGPFYEATRLGGEEHRPYDDREKPEFADWKGWSSHWWSLEYGAKYVAKIAKNWAKALETKKFKGWGDNNPVWKREYLGLWAEDSTTMVFAYQPYADDGKTQKNQWSPKRSGVLQLAELPDEFDDWRFVYIFDKGAGRRDVDAKLSTRRRKAEAAEGDQAREGKGDPFAVNVFAFAPADPQKRIFHVFSFEALKGMHARAFACLLLGTSDRDPLQPRLPPLEPDPGGLIGETGWPDAIVGDCDQGLLDELERVYYVPAAKADKKQDTKTTAIEEVNGDFDEGRLLILKDSPLEKQLGTLQWKPDEYGVMRENKAQANHSTDCLIYGRQAVSRLFESGRVVDESAGRRKPVKTVTRPAKAGTPPPRPAPRRDVDDEDDGRRGRDHQPSVIGDFVQEWSRVIDAGTNDGWP